MLEETEELKKVIQNYWLSPPSLKARNYINKFFQHQRIGQKISAKVEGNHGTYTVSIQLEGRNISSACSCYIGGNGDCHHCEALASTFLKDPKSFKVVRPKKVGEVQTLNDLSKYLKGITLDSLIKELKSKGVTQKTFSESIGMNPRHLASIKSSELRNRFYNELGATKLACLWVLEHCKESSTK